MFLCRYTGWDITGGYGSEAVNTFLAVKGVENKHVRLYLNKVERDVGKMRYTIAREIEEARRTLRSNRLVVEIVEWE